MSGWRWAAASRRGSSHKRSGTPKQDGFRCFTVGETLVAIVSDGAGSAAFGGEGAYTICRSLAAAARRDIAEGCLPTDQQIWSWVDAARDRISVMAAQDSVKTREFSATLVCLISTRTETVVAHVGDGAAVVRHEDGQWRAISWPEHGEYASTTYFVTDEPAPKLRISRTSGPITGAAVFSDGIERLALAFDRHEPHQPFFESMLQPVSDNDGGGRDKELSKALAKFLDSPRVLDRTDDDKTLILAALFDR